MNTMAMPRDHGAGDGAHGATTNHWLVVGYSTTWSCCPGDRRAACFFFAGGGGGGRQRKAREAAPRWSALCDAAGRLDLG